MSSTFPSRNSNLPIDMYIWPSALQTDYTKAFRWHRKYHRNHHFLGTENWRHQANHCQRQERSEGNRLLEAPVLYPQRHRPKDYSSRCRGRPTGCKKGLSFLLGPRVRTLHLQGRWWNWAWCSWERRKTNFNNNVISSRTYWRIQKL